METKIDTFYVVRVTCIFADGRPSEVSWVAPSHHHNTQYALSSDQNRASRFANVTEVRRALKYACVREALQRTRITDYQRMDRDKQRREAQGKKWRYPLPGFVPMIQCRHEAEAMKLTETTTYEEEVIDSLPKRSPLEQLARIG